jgi:hypothetical protein
MLQCGLKGMVVSFAVLLATSAPERYVPAMAVGHQGHARQEPDR